ncbi:Gas vesicle synthesis protein GvpL/GvpF [compost metagenome]
MDRDVLVERARADEFNQAVERLSARYQEILSFKYTGPWPPYSFVKLRLELR